MNAPVKSGFDSRPRLVLDWRIQAAFIRAAAAAREPATFVVGRLVAEYFSCANPRRKPT